MNRSKRFEARVELERSALEIVNKSNISPNTPLAGVSLAAISNLRHRLPKSCDTAVIQQIENLLTVISTEAGLLADNSRAVFAPGANLDISIKARLADLRKLCSLVEKHNY